MDDDDFDSEFLGAAQRQLNLNQNQATSKEIAALRADLNRREKAEKAAPKCPYCFGAITKGAVKCRHCASDIKWCEVAGKAYPLKIDDDSEAFALNKQKELQAKKEQKKVAAKKERERKHIAQVKAKKETMIGLAIVYGLGILVCIIIILIGLYG